MAILDARFRMSNNQTVTSTAVSTNIVDLGIANPNQGAGNRPVFIARVHTAYVSGTSVKATLQESVDEAFTTPLTVKDGFVVLVANAIAGKRLLEAVLPIVHERYIRFNYTVVGSPSAGSIDANMHLGE